MPQEMQPEALAGIESAAPGRLRARPVHVLWAVIVASALVPLVLFAVVAWESRFRALEAAADTSQRTMLALHEHASNVFDTFELVTDRVETEVDGLQWDDVQGSAEIHALLAGIAKRREQIGSIWLVDADGRSRANSIEFPHAGIDLSDRDYLRFARSGGIGPFIGETIRTRLRGRTAFTVTRPLRARDGSLRGAIVITAYPNYFASFYREIAPSFDHSAGLVREDGLFLVRDAVALPSVEQPHASPNFFRAIVSTDEGQWTGVSPNDGIQRIVSYKKLEGYPIYVLFALGVESVLVQWRDRMAQYLLVGGPAVLGLLLVGGFGLVRTQREQVAAKRLNDELLHRKALEDKLRHSEKLDALGKLTGGIAHDFNNILTVVLGNLDLLRRSRDERRLRYIENAILAGEQGKRINEQLLAFGRRTALRTEVADMNVLIAGMDDLLSQSLRGNIKIELDLGSDLHPVEIDTDQFKVAMINLAVNARDAMVDGGTLRIRTENTTLPDDASTAAVGIAISDTGVGIEPALLERVFEPFFTTKGNGKGTGLGLAQVYGFAKQSGGTVHVRSKPGSGTSFTIYLPRTQKRAEPLPVAEALDPNSNFRALRVLLVEDNPEVVRTASSLLNESGHSVVAVSSADEALQQLEAGEGFDLLWSDIMMPGSMNGLDLARAVRERRPDLPVLLSTGYSPVAEQAEKEGFALLRKPYRRPELAAALLSLTARRTDASYRDREDARS